MPGTEFYRVLCILVMGIEGCIHVVYYQNHKRLLLHAPHLSNFLRALSITCYNVETT